MIENAQIAIVGAACLLPGAHDPEQFWANLMAGIDSRRPGGVTEFHIDPEAPGGWGDPVHRISETRAGFVDEPALDLEGLEVPAEHLAAAGRVVTWSVHSIRAAFAAAGMELGAIDRERTGLIFGNYSFPTIESSERCIPLTRSAVADGLRDAGIATQGEVLGSIRGPEVLWPASAPATIVADALGIAGPRLAVDAACASALYSLALGCAQLRSRKVDSVVVGSVCAPDPVLIHLSFSDLKAYPDGRTSNPFDSDSRGIITGQGAGAFVLKRLADAEAAGDDILAVVDSIALGNDGSGTHLLAPSATGQVDVYRRAYRSGRHPDYIECHATGTPLGDETELAGLAEFFGDRLPLLGSVKGNVGHLLTVAGFTSMLKVILSMRHGVIPASPRLAEAELRGPAEVSERIVRDSVAWPDSGEARRAGVSSFGFGGINGHVVFTTSEGASRVPQASLAYGGALAVRGVGAHVASARTAEEFAVGIRNGQPLVRELPPQRWYGLEGLDEVGPAPAGGYFDGIDVDFRTWRMLPNELDNTNPQHLAFYSAAGQALRDAGMESSATAGRQRVAVVVAVELEPRSHVHRARFDVGTLVHSATEVHGGRLDADRIAEIESAVRDAVHRPLGSGEVMSYIGSIMASRVASAFDFTGPAFTVSCAPTDTAQLFDVATLLLSDPELDAVVVGAVDLAAGVENTLARRELSGDPVTLGDGAAAIIVTREEDTEQPAALIESSTTVVGDQALEVVVDAALKAAGRSSNDVELLELVGAHDTAPDGCFQGRSPGQSPSVRLSSSTALVGDVGRAGVLVGVVAAVDAVRRAELPPTPETVALPLSNGNLYRSTTPQPWLRGRDQQRRVAVIAAGEPRRSSAVVVSGDRLDTRTGWTRPPAPLMLPIHAADVVGLEVAAREIARDLADGLDPVAVIRQAVATPRGPVCAVAVATDGVSLLREVLSLANGVAEAHDQRRDWVTPTGSICPVEPVGPGKVAFVYPGAFTSYPGAGGDLLHFAPVLMEALESNSVDPRESACIDFLYPRKTAGFSRRDLLRYEAEMVSDLPSMLASGSTLAIVSTRFLVDVAGIRPDAVFGYSLGESSMLFSVGVWDSQDRDSSRLFETGLFKDDLVGKKDRARREWGISDDIDSRAFWTSRIVLDSPERVRQEIKNRDRVFITHVNSPSEVVLAGDTMTVKAVVEALGATSAEAPADSVMHTPLAAGASEDLKRLNYNRATGVPDAPVVYSAYDYAPIPEEDLRDGEALAQRIAWTLHHPIDFARLVTEVYRDGARYFVDVGPGTTCARWVGDTLSGSPHVAVGIDRRGAGITATAGALASLYANGLQVDLGQIYGPAEPTQDPRWLRIVPCGGDPIARRISHEVPGRAAASGGEFAPRTGDPSGQVEVDETVSSFVELSSTHSRRAVTEPRFDSHARPEFGLEPTRNTGLPTVQPSTDSRETAAAVLESMACNVARAHTSVLLAHDALIDSALRTLETKKVSRTPAHTPPNTPGTQVLGEAELLEFASGSVAAVFGEEYADIDSFPVRVRLPEPPYLFVTRVVSIHATPGRFEPCSIVTEFDIPEDAWFLVDGLAPCAVTIEAGQCDLLLVSYLGVDRRFQGERVYRLLDSRLVFHGPLPRAGQTLRYEIKITRFISAGDSLLFSFRYQCFADGELILELLDATAGFFSAEELENPGGVTRGRHLDSVTQSWFTPLARTDRTSLGAADLDALAGGRLAEVFGSEWDQTADDANRSIRLPDRPLRMIDEITKIDRLGGSRSLGALEARTDLDPQGWYFACHFRGDPVLAGSLVAEGGVQILQAYAMFLGLHLVFPDSEFQSVPGLATSVKVRGQITPSTPSIRYEVDVTEITLLPRPTLIANILVFDGDKPIVGMEGFGIQVRERPGSAFRPGTGGVPPFLGRRNHRGELAFINEFHLAHAAKGDLGTAMGPEFDIYRDRRAPHIPNGDFRFVDRIMELRGTRGRLEAGAEMVTEYDCPVEAWYHDEGLGSGIPHCVLMESSLQAAVLLGYYLGATLDAPEEEFSIRNLDGTATVTAAVDLRGRTIRQRTRLLFSSAAGDVLQKFGYELSVDGEVFYVGESLFGYHRETSLAQQAGLDSGAFVEPWGREAERPAPGQVIDVDSDLDEAIANCVPVEGHLRLLDRIEIWSTGGRDGNGYVLAERRVDPSDWYFECHFHRDPVMPGSLGVEAVIQAVRAWAMATGHVESGRGYVAGSAVDVPFTWRYRGQVLSDERRITVEAHIKEVRRTEYGVVVIADASLWKPCLRIYQLTNIGIEFRPDDHDRSTRGDL